MTTQMLHDHHGRPIPKPLLLAVFGMVVLTLGLTGAVAVGLLDRPQTAQAERKAAGVPIVAERTLVFTDRADGALVITDAGADGALVSVVPPMSEQGFIRGAIRSMGRERRMKGVAPDAPYALRLWGDGRLALEDLGTGRTVELDSFGPDNRAVFRALLDAKGEAA
jgi:putative photosynthetic complex assembly protein